jgi:hypothetical protein
MKKILEGGEFQASTVSVYVDQPNCGVSYTNSLQARERQGSKNDSMGPMAGPGR